MALFTDGPAFTMEELAAHETAILDTASAEGIDLTRKIELAREQVGLELESVLLRHGSCSVGLKNVVVTAPLRLWHVFHTLAVVYRDAYFNQLNDRYKAKWTEYQDLAKWASRMLQGIGVGTVADPIAQADIADIGEAPGALPAGTYFVKVAWRNASGEEGAPSALASIDTSDGNVVRARPSSFPSNGVSWAVYAGTTPEDLFLQAEGLSPATFWTVPDSGLLTARRAGNGQEPTLMRPMPRVLPRG
ncbi:MAG: hypothetical protein ABIZ80_13040 [Bryobacteraceae bacterium]